MEAFAAPSPSYLALRRFVKHALSAPLASCESVCHRPGMTSYTTIPHADGHGFDVVVKGSNGARQTLLGFESEADAVAWIEQDRRLADVW